MTAPATTNPRQRRRPRPSRRQLLRGAAAAGIGAACASWPSRQGEAPHLGRLLPGLREMEQALRGRAVGWVKQGQLTRPDGYLYAVDVGLLWIYCALAGDEEGYDLLRDFAGRALIVDAPGDAVLDGLVQWRVKPGEKPDATGTTETLRAAKALWTGARRFNRPADAGRAVTVLKGYGRHETIDQGIWLIRNFFSFNTLGYAGNSFLVDYDADFLAEVAAARPLETGLARLARNSYGVVERAVTPCGLIYDLVQPELETLVPDLDLAFFSPNDVCGLANCATVALTVAKGRPKVAGGVLAFALSRLDGLQSYYYGRTGEPAADKPAHVYEYATLARLAVACGAGPEAIVAVVRKATKLWQDFAGYAAPAHAYTTAELLLTLRALAGGEE